MPDEPNPKRALRGASSRPSTQAGRALQRRLRRSRPRRGADARARLVDVAPGESDDLDLQTPAAEKAATESDSGESETAGSQTAGSEAADPETAGSEPRDATGDETDDDPDAPGAGGEVDPGARARSRRERFVQSLLRPGRGQIVAAVILLIFGMGGVMQIRANTEDETYSSTRREDLIQLLDGLTQESRRLEGEIVELEQTRNQLQSGADTSEVARQEAEKRVSVLSVLAGTVPAHGPGVRMRISDPQGKVSADLLLDAVEEFRDAGAEVIEFDDSVRVVASTWFGNGPNGLMVDGQTISTPIVIEVIGNPHSLEEAARFRGGLVSEITSDKIGGQVVIEQVSDVQITSLHDPAEPQYAQPASAPPTPR
ncbi:MAG: DUF881 domain-containing protein [Propionibacteriaceae bacterium]